jgi:hypothetical protein
MINNFVFYGVGLKSNDLGMNPYLTFAISATVELIAYIITHFIVDKLGRKYPYCFFLFAAGASCFSITFISLCLLLLSCIKTFKKLSNL